MSQRNRSSKHFAWVPAQGPNPASQERLAKHYPMPRKPMGEAWFMGVERQMYDVLLALDSKGWPADELKSAVEALASGPVSFGHMDEWTEWFSFLVHASLPLIDDWATSFTYESLVSAIMVHCPDSRTGYRYDRFLPDVLATVGQLPFDPKFWEDGHVRPDAFFAPLHQTSRGLIIAPGGSFNAAFFLVAKYLDESLLPHWLASVAAIKDPFWRAKLLQMLWLTAPLLLEEGKGPADLAGWIGEGWNDDNCVKGIATIPGEDSGTAFLDMQRRSAIVGALRVTLRKGRLAAWQSELKTVTSEWDGLEEVVVGFEEASLQVGHAYGLAD